MLTNFGIILLFFIIGFIFVGISIAAASLIRPHKPNPIKNATYECGEVALGSPWIRFNTRFYVIALVFLIFDVEIVLLFPWAVVFKGLGWYAFAAMLVFFFILTLGLVYDWGKGYLDWEKPNPIVPVLSDLIDGKK
ncbi:MAG: NADH-quinone oxidoreductase subunit A [Ignavibacteria bacterium]|nr:NADH-quinone oxidoreductase subunit A [Ignavibacteria bacterium]